MDPHIDGFTYLGEIDNHRYYASTGCTYSWDDANAAAAAAGGYLVTIDDASENSFIANAISQSYAWIGINDVANEGTFEWADGSAVGYTNWKNGQPDNKANKSQCRWNADHGVIRSGNGRWYDRGDCERFQFVMEVECLSPTLVQTSGPASGELFPIGTTEVSYMAYVGADTVYCSFNVTVNDCPLDYCDAYSSCSSYEWIDQVHFSDIANESGNDGGYGDYTGITGTVTAGSSVGISITPGFSGQNYHEFYKVYIDWNRDGDFYDSGEMVFSGHGHGTVAGNIQVPANAASGDLRMRIIQRWNSYCFGPCGRVSYGEVEDYTIVVTDGSAKQGSNNNDALLATEREVHQGPVSDLEFVNLYPNPTLAISNNLVTLEFRSGIAEATNIRIVDMNGKLFGQQVFNAERGYNQVTLDVAKLAAGTYFVEVRGEGFTKAMKLVVK